MATMNLEDYDAFIAAGAPEDKARKAAEARANHDQRFDRVGREIMKVQAE